MLLAIGNYLITGTPQEIKEFIELYETKTTLSTSVSGDVNKVDNLKQVISCPKCFSLNLSLPYWHLDEFGKDKMYYRCKDCQNEIKV